MPKKLWVTYAWDDNPDGDVDLILNKLSASPDLTVHFDRRRIINGQWIWNQIAAEITSPDTCDAWAFVATPASLQSTGCMEELAFAHQRALEAKGENFPIIPMVFKMSPKQLPPALKVRLGVLIGQDGWVDRVVAAAHNSVAQFSIPEVGDWRIRIHFEPGNRTYLVELQPRIETVGPYRVLVPVAEKDTIDLHMRSTAGAMPRAGVTHTAYGTTTFPTLGELYWIGENLPLDHAHSVFLRFRTLPSKLWMGRPLAGTAWDTWEIDLGTIRQRVGA